MTMKKTLLALLIATTLGAANAAPVRAVDRIVAVVNKSAITESDLQKRIKETVMELEARKVTPPAPDVLSRQVLEQMITEEVQVQYATSNGLRVSDGDLQQTLERLASQNKLTLNAMKAQLAKEGVTFDGFREQIRRQILLSRLKEREIESRVTVTDTEVEQVLKSEQTANRSEYRLANILVSVPERADAKQIDALAQKAQKALAELDAGQPFAKVAAAYSDAPNGLKGGDLGWRPASSLPLDFTKLLETLKPGAHTGVIRSQQGFFIFQLQEKRSGDAPLMVEQYHVRHLLVRTNEAVSEADAKTRILQIRDRIERGASFEETAKLYSEDASNTRGGDLGWVNLGDTVPAFEQAMTSLPLNALSEPVRSPFGWHLIKVEGKRTQDVAQDREKLLVKQQIRARKIDEAYLDWVRQLRDSAFVDDRLDEK